MTRGHDPFYEDWMDLDVVGEDEWQPVAPPLGEVQSYELSSRQSKNVKCSRLGSLG